MGVNTIQPKLGKRETSKQLRRQAIVAAARRSFLEDGYAATSMSGLLTQLGGSKATLWSYFRSKEELFVAVVEDVTVAFLDEIVEGLVASADMQSTLVTFCKRFLEKTSQPDTIAVLRLITGESGRFPELGRIFHERAALRIERALAGYLTTQIALGRLHDEGVEIMARVLIGLCTNRQNPRLWGVLPDGPYDAQSDALRFTDYFLRLFELRSVDICRSAI